MNDGQIASIMRCRKSPAWTVRIAVHISATNARTCKPNLNLVAIRVTATHLG